MTRRAGLTKKKLVMKKVLITKKLGNYKKNRNNLERSKITNKRNGNNMGARKRIIKDTKYLLCKFIRNWKKTRLTNKIGFKPPSDSLYNPRAY